MLALVENWKGFEFRVMYMVNLHVTASINIEGIENKWGTPSKHNNVKKKKRKRRRPTNISPQSFNPTVIININVNNRTKINKGKTNKPKAQIYQVLTSNWICFVVHFYQFLGDIRGLIKS